MVEPIIYLGLEIKQRELDSRLRIAINALALGYPVVFGQQWTLFSNADTMNSWRIESLYAIPAGFVPVILPLTDPHHGMRVELKCI